MDPVTLTRDELYELVWSTPMSKLAAQYGLSDVGLAKTCERYLIPRPGRGYWAQLAAKKQPRRTQLPRAPAGVAGPIVLHRLLLSPVAEATLPTIAIAAALASAHPVTIWLERAIETATQDDYGRLVVGTPSYADLCVRRTSTQRAFLLLDALFKALTERGHLVQMKPWGTGGTAVVTVTVAAYGDVRIHVEEKLSSKAHIPSADEREKNERWGWRIRKYDQVPDGDLAFKIEGAHYKYVDRKSWSDTKRQRLENLLGNVVLTIEAIAAFNHREHAEAQEQRRIWQERERQRLRGERLDEWRSWLATDLEQMATAWRTSRKVTEFLNAFEEALSAELRTATASAWLAAARRFTERVNPLTAPEHVAKDLDPSNEILAAFIEEQKKHSPPQSRP